MRGTALGLGIAGGVIGLITSFLEFVFGAIGTATNTSGASTISGLAWLAFVAAIVGLVGGCLALRFMRIAAGMMLAACIAGFIAASAFWTLAGVLLFVGALMAFLAWFTTRNRHLPEPPQTGQIPSA